MQITVAVTTPSNAVSVSRAPEWLRTRLTRWAVTVLTAAVAVLVVSALAFFLTGGRWFIVSTPSMGETAPVGTLVLSIPTPTTAISVGDVIVFHPPTAPAETYTHRVESITATGALNTRGDNNGGNDPWALTQTDVIGRAVALLPGLGWLVQAFPVLLLGIGGLWIITGWVRSGPARASTRVLGVSLILSLTIAILRPLTGFVVVATSSAAGGVSATIVSTALLPIRVSAAGATPVDLCDGQLGQMFVPTIAEGIGHYSLASSLNLPFFGWLVVGLFCLVPLLWTSIIGLPRADADAS